MLDFLGGAEGSGYGAAVLWTLAALLALAIVLFIVRTIRSLTFGTFVAGGRNRKTRLAVMDATAVDSHRRLVLVRRDDIEHLLLIGGPTDVVVERDIRLAAARRPNLTADAAPPPAPQRPAAPPPPRQSGTRQPPAAQPSPHAQSHAPAQTAPAQAAARSAAPARPTPPQAGPPAAPRPAGETHGAERKPPEAEADTLDDSLMNELALSLDEERHAGGAAPKTAAHQASLDDEMARLLNEFSAKR